MDGKFGEMSEGSEGVEWGGVGKEWKVEFTHKGPDLVIWAGWRGTGIDGRRDWLCGLFCSSVLLT
jgi:hypothetical protein